jgi:hypothetical protein
MLTVCAVALALTGLPDQPQRSAQPIQQTTKDNLNVLAQVVAPRGAVVNGALLANIPATGSGQNQIPDRGPELVNLIQSVVSPRTWDVNGGPGTIVYYGNLRVLVIRAPAHVHGEVGNTLQQMRK